MSKMKKYFAIVIACAMITASFSGCAGTADVNEKSSSTQESTTDSSKQTEEKKADMTPITFTMFSKDLNPNYDNFESPIAKEITKRTGVTLKIEYPVGDIVQKVGLMVASGEYPDMLFLGGNELAKFIDAGAILDLTDRIEKDAPNIKAFYGDYLKRLRFSKADPSIYTVGTYGVDEEKWEPTMGFEIQHSAIIEAGYPEVKTLQDAEKVIADYVAKNPTIDGQPTIGLSLIADDWRWQSAVGNMAAFVGGAPDEGNWYVDPKTYDTTFRFGNEDHKEYFKWLNHMNDIGLLDPESFVQKHDHYAAKISAGRVVALNDQKWQYSAAEQTLKAAGKFDKTYGFYPAQLTADGKCGDFIDKGYAGGWGVAITDACKDPDRLVQFIDWMCTDEAVVLNNWGIEGVDYTVENGKRVISDEEWAKRSTDPEHAKKTGIGLYTYPFPMRGRGVMDPTGNLYNPTTEDTIIKNYSDVEKEVLAKYDAKMWRDLYPTKEELGRSDPWGQAWQISIPEDGDTSIIVAKLMDITKQYIAKCVLAKPAEFEKVWSEFQAEMTKAGIEKANAAFTQLVKERVELWQ